jgi:hypothetical protein
VANDVLIGGATAYKFRRGSQEITLNDRARSFSDRSSRLWDAVKAVETKMGFQVLLEGKGQRAGRFLVWSTNNTGVITDRSRWLTGDQMFELGYEQRFDRDFNNDEIVGEPVAIDADGDGLIDGSSIYKLLKDGEAIKLTSRRRTLSDASSEIWNVEMAIATNIGFQLLLEGEGQKAGQFRVWSTDRAGVITGRSRWLTGDQMLERGYEDVFNWDINGDGSTGEPLAVDADGDGLIDGSSIYKLLRDGAAITLTSRGRTLSDAFSRSWDAAKAVRTQTGFQVLLEGQGQRAGQFRVWSANDRGAVFDRSPWATGDQMLALGYEDVFNRDFNNDEIIGEPVPVDADGDGLIDGSSSSIYKLFKNGQAITLTNWGRTFSDASSDFWDAAMAVENVMGFHVLLEGEGRREGRWMVWRTNTLGAVNGWSGWATGDQMLELGYEDVFNFDFNGDGEIKQPSDGFGITGLLPGAGQFLPIVTG